MTEAQSIELQQLWNAKLENHRALRDHAYGKCYAELARDGIAAGGGAVKKLYVIARDNLAELSGIFRDILEDGWSIDSDQNWLRSKLTEFEAFNESELQKIDEEILALFASKGTVHDPKVYASSKSDLNISNQIHRTRTRVLVEKLIADANRKEKERTRADERYKQEHAIRFGTIGLLIFGAALNSCSGCYNRKTFLLNEEAAKRSEKLFVGEESPRLQVIPFAIAEAPTHNSTLNMKIRNYSGFNAKDIELNVMFCTEPRLKRRWTGEWSKSQLNKSSDGVAQHNVGYFFSAERPLLEHLDAYKEVDLNDSSIAISADALHLESVCDRGGEGLIVLTRLKWNNSKGRVYDEINRYRLICTKNWFGKKKPMGRAFTMVPISGTSCE